MRVLIPYDINTTGMRNPFLFLLLRSLTIRSGVEDSCEHGFGWLKDPEEKWDIIHIHWPEELAGYLIPGSFSDQTFLKSHLEELKSLVAVHKSKGSRIVTTVHNLLPHKYRSDIVQRLYRAIYELSDMFVHFGHESVRLTSEFFPDQVKGKPFQVIPHGDYRFFVNETDRSNAREKLGIDPEKPVMLAFGAIRSLDELNLGIDALKRTGLRDSLYLIVGKLPFSYKSQPGYYPMRLKLWMNRHRTMSIEKIIPPEEVQWYLNASDIVFIPRIQSLNSGNVSLAYTFGRVAVGPDWGVIGEELKTTGNPVFEPKNQDSVAEAIARAFVLSKTERGEQNRQYSNRNRGWDGVADRHLELYQDVLLR